MEHTHTTRRTPTPAWDGPSPEERARINRERKLMMRELLHELRTTPKKPFGPEDEPTPEQLEANERLMRQLDREMYASRKQFYDELHAENEPVGKEERSGVIVFDQTRRNKRPTRPPRPRGRPQDSLPAAAADVKTSSSRQPQEFTSLGTFDMEIDFEVYSFEFINDRAGDCFLTPAPPPEIKYVVLNEDSYDIDPPDDRGHCRVVGLRAGDGSVFMTLYKQDPRNHVIAFIA
jgi:hypothetical protein